MACLSQILLFWNNTSHSIVGPVLCTRHASEGTFLHLFILIHTCSLFLPFFSWLGHSFTLKSDTNLRVPVHEINAATGAWEAICQLTLSAFWFYAEPQFLAPGVISVQTGIGATHTNSKYATADITPSVSVFIWTMRAGGQTLLQFFPPQTFAGNSHGLQINFTHPTDISHSQSGRYQMFYLLLKWMC